MKFSVWEKHESKVSRLSLGFIRVQGHLAEPKAPIFDHLIPLHFSLDFYPSKNPISSSGRSEGISYKLLGLSFWREAAVSSHSLVATEYCTSVIVFMTWRLTSSSQLVWPGNRRRSGGVKLCLCITAKEEKCRLRCRFPLTASLHIM